jgi:hypothetical protein
MALFQNGQGGTHCSSILQPDKTADNFHSFHDIQRMARGTGRQIIRRVGFVATTQCEDCAHSDIRQGVKQGVQQFYPVIPSRKSRKVSPAKRANLVLHRNEMKT